MFAISVLPCTKRGDLGLRDLRARHRLGVGVLLNAEIPLHVRSGSERNVHCAPTDARNSWSVWRSSVVMVAIRVYATAIFG